MNIQRDYPNIVPPFFQVLLWVLVGAALAVLVWVLIRTHRQPTPSAVAATNELNYLRYQSLQRVDSVLDWKLNGLKYQADTLSFRVDNNTRLILEEIRSSRRIK